MKTNYTSIYIHGFRGTGKSTLGPIIAEQLQWQHIDMDETIAKRSKKSITELTTDGTNWQLFRQLEHELLQELLTKEKIVVTTGGGTAVNDNKKNSSSQTFGEINAALLKQKKQALVILLIADEKVIADRVRQHELAIRDEQSARPILTEQHAKKMKTVLKEYEHDPQKQKEILIENITNNCLMIYKKRKPLYQQLTKHHINTGKLSVEEAVDAIIKLL